MTAGLPPIPADLAAMSAEDRAELMEETRALLVGALDTLTIGDAMPSWLLDVQIRAFHLVALRALDRAAARLVEGAEELLEANGE